MYSFLRLNEEADKADDEVTKAHRRWAVSWKGAKTHSIHRVHCLKRVACALYPGPTIVFHQMRDTGIR